MSDPTSRTREGGFLVAVDSPSPEPWSKAAEKTGIDTIQIGDLTIQEAIAKVFGLNLVLVLERDPSDDDDAKRIDRLIESVQPRSFVILDKNSEVKGSKLEARSSKLRWDYLLAEDYGSVVHKAVQIGVERGIDLGLLPTHGPLVARPLPWPSFDHMGRDPGQTEDVEALRRAAFAGHGSLAHSGFPFRIDQQASIRVGQDVRGVAVTRKGILVDVPPDRTRLLLASDVAELMGLDSYPYRTMDDDEAFARLQATLPVQFTEALLRAMASSLESRSVSSSFGNLTPEEQAAENEASAPCTVCGVRRIAHDGPAIGDWHAWEPFENERR